MKRIDPAHLTKFYELLESVKKNFHYLDIDNIKSVIKDKCKFSFQPFEKTGVMTAVPHEINVQCKPLFPVASVTSPGNHISEHVGLLELKIWDTRGAHADRTKPGERFIAWLSMTPSGRLIFGMDGVNLDSNGKKISIDENMARYDHRFYNDHKIIRDFRIALVEAFTSTEQSAIDGKKRLLEIFNETLPANN